MYREFMKVTTVLNSAREYHSERSQRKGLAIKGLISAVTAEVDLGEGNFTGFPTMRPSEIEDQRSSANLTSRADKNLEHHREAHAPYPLRVAQRGLGRACARDIASLSAT